MVISCIGLTAGFVILFPRVSVQLLDLSCSSESTVKPRANDRVVHVNSKHRKGNPKSYGPRKVYRIAILDQLYDMDCSLKAKIVGVMNASYKTNISPLASMAKVYK